MTQSIDRDESAMRDLGRSLTGQGFFEIDLVTGQAIWVNEYVLATTRYTLEQIHTMTVFDLTPPEFHEDVRNSIADQLNGKYHRFSIWPLRAADGRLVWWYSVRIRDSEDLFWYRAEYLNTTGRSGPEYSSMCAAMSTTNGYNDLYNRIVDLSAWAKENVERLDKADADILDEMKELRAQLKAAIAASHKAANAAIENSTLFSRFKAEIGEQLSNHTTELLRLISTDAVHDQRIKVFEARIQQTTSSAVGQITKAGDSISRRIVIPAGAIQALIMIVWWILQHFSKK